jgi:very-short-patch-repair endonuclease
VPQSKAGRRPSRSTENADAERTRLIEGYGYRVIRYWNSDVLENRDGVLEDILDHLNIASNKSPPP